MQGITTRDPDDEAAPMAEINIIPLVDIMLVLLVIFMIAAPLSITGIAVELPRAPTKGMTVEDKHLVLSIDADGQYFFAEELVPPGTLVSKLRALYEHRERKLFIRADEGVAYGRVVDALAAAKIAGVHRFAMLTKPGRRDAVVQ